MKTPKKYCKKQTIFSQKVYKIVGKIPKGRVLTYRAVAELVGRPLASRAVGNALNENPDPKTVPCHRVVKSDGSVGGYKYGANKKISLLKREGVRIKGKKVVF